MGRVTVTDAGAHWVCLGTSGGPFQQPGAFQIANALLVGEDVYLFDVGNGVLRQLATLGIGMDRVRGVFVTHHHPDHVADLGPIMLTRWLTPGDRLAVRGPVGTEHLVAGLAAAYTFTAATAEDPARRDIAARFDAADAPQGRGLVEVFRDDAVVVEAVDVDHFHSPDAWQGEAPHAIGYRISASGRVIAYTGDTGPSGALTTLARDADLLVSEVVLLDEILADLRVRFGDQPEAMRRVAYNMGRNHLAPGEIAAVARDAGVRELLLTHFVPLPTEAQRSSLRGTLAAQAPDVTVHVGEDLGVY